MRRKLTIFAALLLGAIGKISGEGGAQDAGIRAAGFMSGGLGDISDDRPGPERVDGIKKMMEKKKSRGGQKDKNLKLPPNFGGRDKGPRRSRKENPRHVKAQHGYPGDLKIPPQDVERRRQEIEDRRPKRKPRVKPSVEEAKAEMERRRRNVRGNKRGPPGMDKRRGGPPLIHTFDVTTVDGSSKKLDQDNFPDTKIFLFVNTATDSEYTSQFEGLEKLHRDYMDEGLQVIAFPSNSFNEEPLDDEQIQAFVDENYQVTFPVMAKCDVNGESSPKLFEYLKNKSIPEVTKVPEWSSLEDSGLRELDIQWNFEKFIVYTAKRMERVIRFPYDMDPAKLGKHIDRAFRVMKKDKKEL